MKSRILIIADDLDEANNFKRSLLSWDYNVVGVETSGEKALKKISELQPDLILMNTVLNGEMDGFEIYSKIKENLDIPIVYLIPQPSENIL
ncbi:MAG: response regulator, partial [Methanothermobacter sp.]